MALTLEAPGSYSLVSSIQAWIYPDIQPVPEVTWNNGFGRMFSFDEIRVPVLVLQGSPGERLHVRYNSDEVSASDIRRKIRQVLGFNVDTKKALKHIRDDPVVRSIGAAVKGIRPYRTDTVFEALVKSIIQQQVSYRAASVLTQRMITYLGTPRSLGNRSLYSFPTPETLMKAGRRSLSDFGLGFKAGYVHNLCSAIDSGLLDVEHLSGKTAADAREVLGFLRGIGDWTIDALAISGLGDYTVFPSGDLGMRNLLGRLYNKGVRMTESQVIAKANSWGNDGPMVLYLLMCADVLGSAGSAGRPKTHKRRPSEAKPAY